MDVPPTRQPWTGDVDSAVLYRDLRRQYKQIVHGEGVYLTDSAGRTYIDAVGGAAVNIVGHGLREIVDNLIEEAPTTSFVYSAFLTNPWQEELAKRLSKIAPVHDGRVFFVSGGSEANESAVKLARQYHLDRGSGTKWKIISRDSAYHGNTLAMLGISGRPSWASRYAPLVGNSPKVAAAFCYRCPFSASYPGCGIRCAEDLERLILQEGPETVAAFIAEPVSGTSLTGATPVPGYYEQIAEICRRYDVLFIVDEVMTGYGRTGRPFAIEHWNVRPDIITVGKGIGSGYVPIGACIADGRMIDTIKAGSGEFVHGFTFGGMPMACAIALNVSDYIEQHNLFELAAMRGKYLGLALHRLATSMSAIGDVRGLGLLQGVEIVANPVTREPFDASLNVASRVVDEAESRGVFLREGSPGANRGKDGDQIQITPPFIITEKQIDKVVDVLGESIRSVLGTSCRKPIGSTFLEPDAE